MSGMGTGGLALESELSVATSAGSAVLRAQLSPVEFALFAQYGVRRTLQADQVLFRRGDLGSSMFIIVSGTVSLDFGAGLAPKPPAAAARIRRSVGSSFMPRPGSR